MKALFAAASGVPDTEGTGQGSFDLEPPSDLWPKFLAQLAAALRADSASLHLIQQGKETQQWQTGTAQVLPQIARLEKMRNDRVYSQLDFPQLETGSKQKQQPLRALRCAVGREGFAVLILQRRDRDFRAVGAAQLSQLVPYLGAALRCWDTLNMERARAALERRIAQGLGAFWLRLTPSGRVIDMATELHTQLGTIAWLRLQPNGWLAFSDPTVARRFRQALATAQATPTTSCRVDVVGAPHLQILIRAEGLSGEPTLLALLRQMPPAGSLPVEHVATYFDLSRSEARLIQRLCDGFSLQEAALDLGWTLETVRSCSKKIFARMGVRGQTGVLRQVLASAVWLR